VLSPHLESLPEPQQRLWPELKDTPKTFVLYGGTAIALYLGHRQSEDFDFFASQPFNPTTLLQQLPYLRGAQVQQQQPNTLTCLIDRGGPVQVSFFGELPLRRIGTPKTASGPGIQVATLMDLAATKAQVVQSRASAKDYLDLDVLIQHARISLSEALGAAQAVYGDSFNPLLTLKALTFFGDGDLHRVPGDVRQRLAAAVKEVDLEHIPILRAQRGLAPGGLEL
jgi:hypothetical protein